MSGLPVSVVVPSWGRQHALRRCVDSITTAPDRPGEIIIVDSPKNGSYASATLESKVSQVIRTKDRVSIPRARNIGASSAREEYLFFLDSDNLLPPSTLPALVDAARANRGLGVVGPISCYSDAPSKVWSAGAFKTRFFRRNYVMKSWPSGTATLIDVDVVQNASLVPSSVFVKVGGFDDRNFTIQEEEAEFQLRCREAGYRTVICPSAIVYHAIEDSPLAHISKETLRAAFKARIWLERLHNPYRIFGLAAGVPAYVVYYMVKSVSVAQRTPKLSLSFGWAVIQGTFSGLAEPPKPQRSFLPVLGGDSA
jgi:GT2 family glycosyltransferase